MHNFIANHLPRRRFFFDVSGLVQWFAYESKPSGIQRVNLQILQAAIKRSGRDIELIARCPGSMSFFSVSRQFISELVGPSRPEAIRSLRQLFISGMRSAHPLLFLRQARMGHVPYAILGLSRLAEVGGKGSQASPADLKAGPAAVPGPGDVIVGLGAFWCYREHVNALVDLKKKSGATLSHMVHDLFALDHPEWGHPYYGPEFAKQFAFLAPHVDHWLTNSSFVKSQLGSYIEKYRIAKRPIDVVPMGWDSFPDRSTSAEDQRILNKHGLNAGRYILHVGTVEPRKNLPSLIDVMCKLRDDLGDQAPACVFVGRAGWRAGEVQKHLGRTSFGGGAIRWLQAVEDADLPSIYRAARFTVMPSFAEGWGLPVQESLAHGVPCIASDAGGLPEAGRDLAHYVDPRNAGELFAAVMHWIRDEHALNRARSRIRFRLKRRQARPTWDDAARTVLEATRSLQDHQWAEARASAVKVTADSQLFDAIKSRSAPGRELDARGA